MMYKYINYFSLIIKFFLDLLIGCPTDEAKFRWLLAILSVIAKEERLKQSIALWLMIIWNRLLRKQQILSGNHLFHFVIPIILILKHN